MQVAEILSREAAAAVLRARAEAVRRRHVAEERELVLRPHRARLRRAAHEEVGREEEDTAVPRARIQHRVVPAERLVAREEDDERDRVSGVSGVFELRAPTR